MPRVPITDLKQLARAIEVLTRVGGTYHGVAQEKRSLLVNEAQYQALVDAKVVSPGANGALSYEEVARYTTARS